MKLVRWRPIAAAAVFILVLLIAVMIRACGTKKDKVQAPAADSHASDGNYAGSSYDMPETSAPPISQESSVTTTSETPEYQDVEYVPDDVSLVNAQYLSDVVVIGDSIAKGYGVYGRLPVDNVLAVGSVGARNLFTYKYEYQGFSLDLLDIISRKLPKYIFISVGMNDVNILSQDEYTEVYKSNIEKILETTPQSKIFAMAVTPITSSTDFSNNDKIDTYNEALKEMVNDMKNDSVYYINAAQFLKNEYNYLTPEFSSGDGIHLAANAYDYLLSYMLTAIDWIK